MVNKTHSILFEPFQIGRVEIKNKFCMMPMGTIAQCDDQRCYTQDAVEYYAARARGGVGLIITGANYVESDIEQHKEGSFPCPNTNPEMYKKPAKDLIDMVHPFGTKIFLQLTAGFGRSALPDAVKDKAFVAPSPILNRWFDAPCRELTTAEVESIVEQFAKAAKIAKEIGFDGIEIHAVHEGYLLDCFTMALFNKRKDKYGGDLRGRLTFPIEIVQAIKKACGQNFPVILRFSIKSYIKALRQGALPQETFEEQGRDIEEALEAAKILEAAGYDAFDADAGSYDSWYWPHPPMYFENNGMYLPLAEKLKQVVTVPVIVAGRMENPDLAVDALTSGKIDAVGIGRQLLTDADYVNKVKKGNLSDIRPCLGCHDGCFGRLIEGGWGSCAVNPMCGRELITAFGPATKQKNIVIVGGGPAGLEAARISAIRGHNVTLLEANNKLGGELLVGGRPKFKHSDLELAEWYTTQLKELGVKVCLEERADKAKIDSLNPDIVYTAEGSIPIKIKVPGIENKKVVYANEVLSGVAQVGQNCLIIGGGLVGCELALHLAQNGKNITIVDALDDILESGAKLPPMNEFMLRDELTYYKVQIAAKGVLNSITDQGADVAIDGKDTHFDADNIIIAIGYHSVHPLFDEIKNEYPEVYNLGDSRQVRNIRAAIWDGFEVARVN